MKRFTNELLVAACVLVAACDQPPDYVTQQGQIGLSLVDVSGDVIDAPADHVDLVVGSTVCFELRGWFADEGREFHIRSAEDDDEWLRECFDLGAGPGATLDDSSCMTLDAAGETALEMAAKGCALNDAEGPGFDDDRLLVAAHALEDLVLTYEDPILRAIHGELDPGPAGEFGPAPQRPAGEPVRVLADGAYTLFAQPALAVDPSRTVAFTGGTPRAVAEVPPESFAANPDGTAVIDLAIDQSVAIALDLPAGTLMGDEIIGVDPAIATSMELVVGYQKCRECTDGYGVPSYALAIVRDAEGGRLFGANVEFAVDGRAGKLAVAGAEGFVSFEDVCDDDSEGDERSATLNATYGELAASASLEFVCPDPGDVDGWDVETVDDSQDNDLDLFGCGCSTDDRGPGAAGLLAVVLGLAARRRRRIQ